MKGKKKLLALFASVLLIAATVTLLVLTTSATTEAPATPVTQADLDNAKAAILAAAQEKIDEINQRLANGEDFEALIPEYTADSDNLYEVCIASSNYVPEFVEAAFSVENVGDVSAPYISQFGIHIVKYMEDIPAAVSLNEAIELVKQFDDPKMKAFVNGLLNGAKNEIEEAKKA